MFCLDRGHQLRGLRLRGQDPGRGVFVPSPEAVHQAPLDLSLGSSPSPLSLYLPSSLFAHVLLLAVFALACVLVAPVLARVLLITPLALARAALIAFGLVHNQRQAAVVALVVLRQFQHGFGWVVCASFCHQRPLHGCPNRSDALCIDPGDGPKAT